LIWLRGVVTTLASLLLLAPCLSTSASGAPTSAAVQIRLDTSEADATLALLERRAHHQVLGTEDWDRVFSSVPYRRLVEREAYIARLFKLPGRGLDERAFRAFLESDSLLARADSLRTTLERWKHADLTAEARRILDYLPAGAIIHASVYPVIKPLSNSFVFDVAHDPAIFLWIDPNQSQAKFSNTVAHELHHIGFASLSARQDSLLAGLAPDAKAAVHWLGAFGEGLAMLAAAGGPDISPHAASDDATRRRWEGDVARADSDLVRVEAFVLDVAEGRLRNEAVRDSIGGSFFGVQGPWYTVGWVMASEIERHEGRGVLIACMLDPRRLLVEYDRVLEGRGSSATPARARWSPRLLKALGVDPP
jgi:hypothetical protein